MGYTPEFQSTCFVLVADKRNKAPVEKGEGYVQMAVSTKGVVLLQSTYVWMQCSKLRWQCVVSVLCWWQTSTTRPLLTEGYVQMAVSTKGAAASVCG